MIVTVAAPTVALAEAVSVSVEVALPFAAGVTGLVENAAVTPVGRPVAVSVVAELKPPVLVMVMVLVPLAPWVTVTDAGEAPMVKFGVAVALTVRAMVVVAVRLPEVPVMVPLERGDLQLISNTFLQHSRTSYEDFAEPELKRHYLRLWLADRAA